MTKEQYQQLCTYMEQCLSGEDSAHDKEHCYRVLYHALDLAVGEKTLVDYDVLIAACLLHDVGREEQHKDKSVCHAEAGSQKAQAHLLRQGWNPEQVKHIAECIYTHRFRSEHPPQTSEAKILFDADKLDVCGTMGIARTLLYQGKMKQPIYSVTKDGRVLPGDVSEQPSFLREYHRKLKHVQDRLYTDCAKEIARQKEKVLDDFYKELLSDVQLCYSDGKRQLQKRILNFN